MSSKVYGRPGFCLVKDIKRANRDDLKKLSEFPVALIGDGYGRRGIMDAGIKPLNPQQRLVGPAITVETHPADNLMIHIALKVAQEGDILVINAHGNLSAGIFGDLLCNTAVRKKLGGIIVDGAVRDSLELIASGLPIYARGINPMGGGKEGPGQVNMTVCCGGVSVNPGDMIIGDADGIIVVPPKDAQVAIAGAEKKYMEEKARIETIQNAPLDKISAPWLAQTLIEQGFLAEGEEL